MLKSGSPLTDRAVALQTPGDAEDGLSLWLLQLSEVAASELDPSPLDEDERRQAARLHRPEDRLGYIAAHAFLRQLLGERLGLPASEVALIREACPACGDPHGRPALERPPLDLHFSLSRSGDLVLIGIGPERLGVDVEALPKPDDVTEVAAELHPSERAEIESVAPSERAQKFARVWTRKEAYLKGLGVGIATGLAAEYLGAGGRAEPASGWTVLDLEVPTGYAAALAIAPRASTS